MYIYVNRSYTEKHVRLDKIFFYFPLFIALSREEKEVHLCVLMHSNTKVCSVPSYMHFYCKKVLLLESISFNLFKCQRGKKAFATLLNGERSTGSWFGLASSFTEIKPPQIFLEFVNIIK